MTNNISTKQFVDIHDIRDGIVILKNGSLRIILEISSINFDLKSADEQTAIVRGFKDFLNALDFPLQIVVHSRRLDIKNYLEKTQAVVEKTDNELLRIQGVEYLRFVRGLTELANIMSKKFYIIVPFYAVESAAVKKSFVENIKSAFSTAKEKIKTIEKSDFEAYKSQVKQKAELVSDGLQGLGLIAKILSQEELTNMFYSLYNPG